MDKETFMSQSSVVDDDFGYSDKYYSKVKSGEDDGYYWIVSPLVEYYEPHLNSHTGVYSGSFDICKGNIIYHCDYSMSRRLPLSLIAFMNVKPKKVSAEKLINKFGGVENMHNISEEEYDTWDYDEDI